MSGGKGIFTAAHLASGEDRRAGKGFDKFTSIFRNHNQLFGHFFFTCIFFYYYLFFFNLLNPTSLDEERQVTQTIALPSAPLSSHPIL